MNDMTQPAPLTPASYKSGTKPIWCPGCGDYTVLNGVLKAVAIIGKPPHEVAVVSGIGCSSRIPAYTSCYGFMACTAARWPPPPGSSWRGPT